LLRALHMENAVNRNKVMHTHEVVAQLTRWWDDEVFEKYPSWEECVRAEIFISPQLAGYFGATDDAESLVRLRELVVAGRGGNNGNQYTKAESGKADNVSIATDLFVDPEPAKKKADAGNSRAYTLTRLKNERPDLFEKVCAKELTANRAADELWGGPVGQGLLKGQERDMKKLDKICARIEARRG
jgi:hypothetical protein